MECMTPFTVRSKISGKSMAVPCGKCPGCTSRRSSAWSFRLLEEEKVSISSHFITLTYSTKHVPITTNGYLGLKKDCLQRFFKRLRKLHTDAGSVYQKIKYYAVGEYGSATERPHYHIILFNAKVELIQKAWDLGNVHYGDVNGASIAYTLKYISKKSGIYWTDGDDREREFALISKGIGESYLTSAMKEWHLKDKANRMYCNLPDNIKVAMPRYYKQKIYSDQQRKAIASAMRIKADKLEDKLYKADKAFFEKKFQSNKAAFRKAERAAQNEKL